MGRGVGRNPQDRVVAYIASDPEVHGAKEKEQPHLGERLLTPGDCTPRGHLVMSGDILGCHSLGEARGVA